ncbi:hypothetical protein [Vibrio sp. WXL103]|uniref:hypothetical protein n=1 Tax=Vibrio sp. WXL103 TaxID=3450710 RepID=UPI003EC5F6C4
METDRNPNAPQFGKSIPTTAQESLWRQMAPGMAGSNMYVATDSVDPEKVWVVPDMGNDYVSLDGGKHWQTTIPVDEIWTQRNRLSATYLGSDPKDKQVVIGLKGETIQLSTDGGIEFNPITNYSSGAQPNSSWYTAYPHPKDKDTWYVANGLDTKQLRSGVNLNPLDGIDSQSPKVWKITNITSENRTISAIDGTGMSANTAVFDLFAHPDTSRYPEMIFAATSTGFYRKSEDSNWVRLINSATRADYHWDNRDNQLTVYVLKQATYSINGNELESQGGVFKTTQPESVIQGNFDNKTSNLYVDLTQLSIDRWLVNTMAQWWFEKTSDELNTLNMPSAFFQDFVDIKVDPTNPDRVYMSVWGGHINKPMAGSVWATSNGGDSWAASLRVGSGFQKDDYWAQNQPGNIEQNLDLQVNERKFPEYQTYGRRGVRSMSVAADGSVYASAIKGYYTVKYHPDKDWWESVDNTRVGKDTYFGHGNADTGAFAIAPDPHRPGEMLLLPYELSAWRVTGEMHEDYPGILGAQPIPALVDVGETWAPGQPMYTPTTVAAHPTDPSVLYALSQRTGNLYKVSNNGTELEAISEPIEVPDTINVDEMKTVYWTDLRIVNGGKTMYAVAEIIDTDNRPMGQVQIFNPESQKGIYKSTDHGVTWVNMNRNLPKTAGGRDHRNGREIIGDDSAAVKSLIVDPHDANTLYAAVRQYLAPVGQSGRVDGGLYISKNGAWGWEKAQIPEGIKSVWGVWIHADQSGNGTNIYLAGGDSNQESISGEGGLWKAAYKREGNYQASDWSKIFDHPFVSAVETSPFDENFILVVTRETVSNDKEDAGTYYSVEGGKVNSWVKFNQGRGSMMVGKIAFDNATPNRVWCAAESSGVYTALLPTQ